MRAVFLTSLERTALATYTMSLHFLLVRIFKGLGIGCGTDRITNVIVSIST